MINPLPIVSVIVPTTHDRMEFNNRIEKIFYLQDYPNKQLLFDYDDGSVGEKRNRLCEIAIGEMIVHFDSDDAYSTDWITKSVKALQESEADIVGLAKVLFYNKTNGAWYVYSFELPPNNWVAGATLCYWKEFWRHNPFQKKNIGEDVLFLGGVKQEPKIKAINYTEGFVATIHANNTSKKILDNPRFRRCTEEEEHILFARWDKLLKM